MTAPLLYRRRFIPNELIPLKDDIILVMNDDLIITKWNTLHPRNDISRGVSAYFLTEGFKVSKMYNRDNKVVYWYCDIIQINKDAEKNTVIVEDLLIDVILYDDGTIRILDIDELSDALEQCLITQAEATKALRTLDHLLKLIYEGHFDNFKEYVNQAESTETR
jgi:predicted RNA-binding protein associated with RNAse of E/G family